MAVARSLWGHIERRDHRLMRRMNRWRAPRWIRIWTITATRLGDGWVWYGLGFLLLGFGGPRRFAAVGAAAAAAVLGIFVFKALKHLSQRPRPCQIEPHSWSKILLFLALNIAISRIVLGMHFLSDVLAGIVLGVALGCASITAFASMGLV